VTQSVFLKIWSDPTLFRDGNFAAWIARIARNRAYDVVRSRALQAQSELPESMPVEEAVEETALAHISGERVRVALAQLPLEQREPIELGFFGGITQEQIARTTGLPLGTIKTRIRTGLRRLRAALEETVTV